MGASSVHVLRPSRAVDLYYLFFYWDIYSVTLSQSALRCDSTINTLGFDSLLISLRDALSPAVT
jgi:hypothetical protein